MSGWRYSAQVTDFTKEERSGEEIAVYYQVDVLVQAPGAEEPSPPTTVWRRYSEFRQLHANLKRDFPELFKRKELEPPSKHALRFVNNNDRLLHERRRHLESWLWALLSHQQIAHSRHMKAFLQLNLALRGATATSSVREFAEDDEHLETSSELSAPSGITNLSHAITDVPIPGTARFSTRTDSLDAYRMGLRVEQRKELKTLMKVISTSLEQVSKEARDLAFENRSLRQENSSLEDQVMALNRTVQDGAYSKDERNEELSRLVAEKETSLKVAHDALKLLEGDLKDSKRRCENLEVELCTSKREAAEKMEKQLGDKAVLESKLQVQTVTVAQLEQQLLETRQQSRQDNKLLAEAVKTLRQEKALHTSKLRELEEQLSKMDSLKDLNQRTEAEKESALFRIQELENEVSNLKADSKQQLESVRQTATATVSTLKQRHSETVQSMEKQIDLLKAKLESLEKEKEGLQIEVNRRSDVEASENSVVRLVLQIGDAPPNAEEMGESELCREPTLSLIPSDIEELKTLKEELSKLQEENSFLKSRSLEETKPVFENDSNLEGLMFTIQHLQDENNALAEKAKWSADSETLKKFCETVEGLYRQLQNTLNNDFVLKEDVNPEQMTAFVEQISIRIAEIQQLASEVEIVQKEFSGDLLPQYLVVSVTKLLSALLQKCKVLNEMKVDALLSKPTTPTSQTPSSMSRNAFSRRVSPRIMDSSSAPDDASQSGTPAKTILGNFQAKMSQGTQGFMSFMQRTAPPADADPYNRRNDAS